MEEKIIKSYDDCKNIVEKLQWEPFPYLGTTLFYRGHSKLSYKLIPSIARTNAPLAFIKLKEWILEKHYFRQKDFQIDKSYELNCNEQNWYNWFQYQHCGGETRLLDWSQCWEVALFFAVKDNFSTDGSLWVAKARNSLIKNDNSEIFKTDYRKQEKSFFLNPPSYWQENQLLGETRRRRQHGFFFYFPIEKIKTPLNLQNIPELSLEVYTIPANAKKGILQVLENKGYTEDFLFAK